MFSLQTKATFYIYLAFYVSAEPVIRAFTEKAQVHGPEAHIKASLHHLIDLKDFNTSPLCDSRFHDNIATVGSDIFRLRTVEDMTFCDAGDAYNYAIHTFSNNTFSNNTDDVLARRQVPGAEIVLVKVSYIVGTGFVGSISLVAVASVVGIALAITAIWFLSKYLNGKGTTPTKRDKPQDPNICCPPPPPPPSPQVQVSWSDAGPDTLSAVEEDRDRDDNAAQSCVQQLENWNGAASGGCCLVEMIGSKGWDYKSAIGAATLGPNDRNFICYQEHS